VIRVLPFSGTLFAVGTFALLGFPPFGSFMAEMLILSGIVQAGNLMAFTLMCTLLTIIFVATGRSIFPCCGAFPSAPAAGPRALDHRHAQAGLRLHPGAAGHLHAQASVSDLLQVVAIDRRQLMGAPEPMLNVAADHGRCSSPALREACATRRWRRRPAAGAVRPHGGGWTGEGDCGAANGRWRARHHSCRGDAGQSAYPP
jgi:hypothetical protein